MAPMVLPEFLIVFRDGSWHIECGNQMFGSYETLVSATTAAIKIARFNLAKILQICPHACLSRESMASTRRCGFLRNRTYTSSDTARYDLSPSRRLQASRLHLLSWQASAQRD